MAKTDLQTCVVFRSSVFNVNWPNRELGVESMEELGRDCAEFLSQRLRGRDGINDIGEIERDGWGWGFDVTLSGEMYYVCVMGAMGPQPIYWWSVQVLPLGILSWVLRRPRKHFAELLKILDQVLVSTDGITDVTWTTDEQYLSLDLQTLEAKPKRR